jgi:CubicO group peptidase (beta-lactamase class C family)
MFITIGRLVVLLLLASSSISLHAQSPSADKDELIHKIETCLPPAVVVKGEPPSCTPLLTRMQQLQIPGVSIAVVHHGVIEWARGYGIVGPDNKPVTPETIFQAGSISKPVASMGTLHLVQEGKLSLDADVNTKLTSWKVPASDAAPGAVVTLRELITHTAGMTVHGFPGYAATGPHSHARAGTQWREAREHGADSHRNASRHEVELLGRRLHHHAATCHRRFARAVSEAAARRRSRTHRHDAQHV